MLAPVVLINSLPLFSTSRITPSRAPLHDLSCLHCSNLNFFAGLRPPPIPTTLPVPLNLEDVSKTIAKRMLTVSLTILPYLRAFQGRGVGPARFEKGLGTGGRP